MGVTATYKLEVDWNNDGDFSDAGEDISSDWMSATIDRGYANPLARVPGVARASFVLKNAGLDYSPPSQANVLPRRAVKFSMTYSGSTAVLFRGFIESITPTFGTKLERRATLDCVDAIALLDLYEGAIALQTNVYADDVIQSVVAAAYTPPATNYQSGLNLFPTSADRWAWSDAAGGSRLPMQETRAAQKILAACASDWGRFFIAKNGTPTYFNRHQMPLDTTTKLTLSDTMVQMGYQKAVAQVFNYSEITCHPRTVGTVNEVVGRISQHDAPVLEANDSRTFIIRFRDSINQSIRLGGKDCLTPVSSTDFDCTSDPAGEGSNENGGITPSANFYGDHAEVTLANGAAYPVYVQKLQVRGEAVRAREPVTMVAQDATSITAYQRRKLRINAPLMSSPTDAQLLADYLLDYYKDPRDDVRGITIFANKNATFMAAVRDLELMDRIVVTESQTGLSAFAGFIYRMTHRITNKFNHRLTFSLEEAYSIAGTPFRIDVSALNSGHVLIY
jgi:hypothetical protein